MDFNNESKTEGVRSLLSEYFDHCIFLAIPTPEDKSDIYLVTYNMCVDGTLDTISETLDLIIHTMGKSVLTEKFKADIKTQANDKMTIWYDHADQFKELGDRLTSVIAPHFSKVIIMAPSKKVTKQYEEDDKEYNVDPAIMLDSPCLIFNGRIDSVLCNITQCLQRIKDSCKHNKDGNSFPWEDAQ